ALEPGGLTAVVVGRQIVDRAEAAGEESTAQWAVGDEADAELAAGGKNFVLGIAGPERVLGLERGDRVLPHRAPDGDRRSLAETQVPNLAGAHEVGHGAKSLLDRHAAVHAVLEVEIDVV